MTPQEFIAKWQAVTLSERSACQQHFLDLCELLQQPKPAAADPAGAWYCFERGVTKTEGGKGWADVWMRDHFGWEYKGKHKDLKAAYNQLLQYHESLDSPPLLVVCDMDRFEIHTKFTGTAKKVYEFNLAGLGDPKNLETLRRLFTDPDSLKPGLTSRSVTEQASEHFGRLADGLRIRGVKAHEAARFLMKLMFCMFAEDIELLPNHIFAKALTQSRSEPERLSRFLQELFQAMAHGGQFALEDILYFNGGLFADSHVIELRESEIPLLIDAASFDWSVVEPHIFGTLFERTLDPAKRSQIGAHYTSSEDIQTLLEPVMMAPLRREWDDVRARCEKLVPKLMAEAKKRRTTKPTKDSKTRRDFNKLLRDFLERLGHVSVLDPACGSGNFLYVALRLLLDLEKEVIAFAATHKLGLLPQVRPTQLHGIEINPFAQELAQVVIWIGYLQWMRDNGFNPPRDPVLEPIESIENRDAILDLTNPENPQEPEWPAAQFIVGNPPFLGDKLMRGGLGDEYVNSLRQLYEGRIPAQSDICCYWFEKARHEIRLGRAGRVGLLGTQGIRGGSNRVVLQRILDSGGIFFAVSDRHWILEGAHVHVSMVGFDNGSEVCLVLDGNQVDAINSNLTTATDVTASRRLHENSSRGFIGISMHGDFDVDEPRAVSLLLLQGNPDGKVNSDVIRPILNASEIARRVDVRWIIAFHPSTDLTEAARYQEPLEHVRAVVKPKRDRNRRKSYRERWWLHGEPRGNMQAAIASLGRYLVTPRVAKHRIFVWVDAAVLASDATVAFASDSDYFFGILHSSIHELWALAQGTQLREKESGFRYTPTSCFETFPFPEPTNAQREAIAAAAKELNELREGWLNPPEWTRTEVLTFPGSPDGPWARYVEDGVVRYPRLAPKDEACAKQLKKRTLTNLYNQRPTWLDLAHRRLDEAVLAAYGWPADITDDDLLANLLELNLARAAAETS